MLQAVAHDVKNKLAELAMRLMDTDIEAAALALDSADKLSQALLIDNPDQLATHIDAACPRDLVEELSAVFTQLFPNKTLIIRLESVPELWYYDVTLLRLALSNVVDNALKHCAAEVTLWVGLRDGYLTFVVSNDGEGFPDDVLCRNWDTHDPTADTIRRSTGHSTGMGLLLAHRIVNGHCLERDGTQRCGFMQLANVTTEAAARATVTLAVP